MKTFSLRLNLLIRLGVNHVVVVSRFSWDNSRLTRISWATA
jgi:hypothetical protein